jgi:hypothetical protein
MMYAINRRPSLLGGFFLFQVEYINFFQADQNLLRWGNDEGEDA